MSDETTTEVPPSQGFVEFDAKEDIFTLLNEDSVRRNPYPTYARYRTGQRVLDTGAGVWFLFGHDDCNRMLRDRELSVDERHALLPGPGDNLPTLIHLDPPDHERLRRLVQLAFTPQRVDALRLRVHELVSAQLDRWHEGDEVDVIAELAYPVPLTIICELLGIEEDGSRHRVQEWSTWIARSIDPAVLRSPELNQRIETAQCEFVEEIRQLITVRRVTPGEDLLSQLVIAEADGDRLTELELLGLAVLLLVAGHETTVSLIGNSLYALLNNPEQLALARGGGHERVLIDEMLRFDSPVQMTSRVALKPIEIGEVTIPIGHVLVLMLGAANRDPAVFENPDQLDVTRDSAGHLAFGSGIHHCLGAALARAEGEIAVTELIRRFPHLTLLEEPPLRPTFVLRGRAHLRIRL